MKKPSLIRFCAGAFAVAALAGAIAVAQTAARPDGYHLAQRVSLPSGGGWDYLGIDVPAQRLYVSAGSFEDVVNARTYKLVGQVTGLHGTHGVAISDQDGHGFTSNGQSQSSTEFDLKTLKVIKQIPLPLPAPDGIIYDPASDRVFFFDHDSMAAALDAKTGAVVGTIHLPSQAAEYAAADGRGHVFDNLNSSNQEIEIDSNTLKITHVYSLAPCVSPSGLSMDTAHDRLFVGCHASTLPGHGPIMAIMNASTGKIVTTIPIGPGVDATRFDPGTQLAFASNGGNGTLTVIHEDSPDHFTLVGNVPTASGARTMEVDPETHTVFEVTARFNLPPGGFRRGPGPGRPGPARRGPGGRRGPGRGFFSIVPGSFQLLVIPNH